jgi:hypothetical protein
MALVRSAASGDPPMRTAIALIVILGASPVLAQPAELAPPPPVVATRLDSPLDIDGALEESIWHTAPAATAFHQRDPVEWAEASQQTEVRVVYDDAALYIGARLFDTAPDSVMARLGRRDSDVPGDRFTVWLDPLHDRRSGYYFAVMAGGTLLDGTLSNDGAQDASWDGVWQGKARRDEHGWTVEMRIPFSQMRYTGGASPVWGINFARTVQRRSERIYMAHQPKKGSGFVSRFPLLEGLHDLRAARNLELLPYVTSKAEYLDHSAEDPFNDGSKFTQNVGGDLRASVGSRMTLNATVNPDFGQVEVDPAVVNLSDTETYFQEKRPFFVEGMSYFRFGNEGSNSYWNFNWPEPTFFYSRRIGRAPQGSVPDDAIYTSVPNGTTILGAAKLTGKVTPTWNFGTLHALTGREQAKLSDGISTVNQDVEPLTYYGVARGLHEFKDRRLGLGLLGSVVARRFDDPALRDELNGTALVGGFDGWAFFDQKRTWVVSGYSAMSYVQGTRARLTALQQDPRHYFQRPDARQVSLDTLATSMTGGVTRLWLNKQSGKIILNSGAGFVTPGLEMNDIGFMRQTDVINGHTTIGYQWTDPTKLTKAKDVEATVFASSDFDGYLTSMGYWTNGSIEFCNNYSWNASLTYNPQTVNDRATRGGPRMINPPGVEFDNYFDTDGKSTMFYYVDFNSYYQPGANAYFWTVSPGITFTPRSNLKMSVGPGFTHNVETAGFVDIYPDPTATATYGSRYVFADLDQKEFSANIRVDWSFTPALSFQLFAQPLISTGDYTHYKELARGMSYDFNVFGTGGSTFDPVTTTADPDGAGPAPPIAIGNRDFNYRSLRGNAVLRWEYMPGSTLFLVWTQSREESEDTGDFSFDHSMHQMVNAPPNDIFLAKLTWYFSP